MQPARSPTWLFSMQQEHYELLFCVLFLHSIVTLFIFQRKKVLHIMHLAKHSLIAADLRKNCISIHCAPIKVNCNLFIISLNLIYCKMNSIYRCSNSCANHSSSHWTGLCFYLRHSSSCFRDQSTSLNFPKRWPCAWYPLVSLVSPCPTAKPLPTAGTHACSVEERGTARPIPVPPSDHSPPWCPHTEAKGRGCQASRPLETGYSVWGNRETAVHVLFFGHLDSTFLSKTPPLDSIFSNFIFCSYYSCLQILHVT